MFDSYKKKSMFDNYIEYRFIGEDETLMNWHGPKALLFYFYFLIGKLHMHPMCCNSLEAKNFALRVFI